MERIRTTPSNEALLQDVGLKKGSKIRLEKIEVKTNSPVPTGSRSEGILQDDIRIGEQIILDSGAQTSRVKKVEKRKESLVVVTETSTYRLHVERSSEGKLTFDDIEMVETAKGSTYQYLPDGTTKRFKKVEGKEYEPQAALVYVPNWDWVKQHATPELLKQFGTSENFYTQSLLTWVQNPLKDGRKVYIVNEKGAHIETNQAIKDTKGPVYLVFVKDGAVMADFALPVSHTPRMGWLTFDTREYTDTKTGDPMRERHLGNAVVKIVRKKQ